MNEKKKRAKKVLIRAYVNGNLGDDLFVKILCERYPNTKFYLIGEKSYRSFFEQTSNLRYIVGDSLIFKVWNRLYVLAKKAKHELIENNRNIMLYNCLGRFFDENIYITGSFFAESTSWRKMIDQKWYETKPYIIGCNFGPYHSKEFLEQHRDSFRKTTQVCFRDKKSYDLFSDLENVNYATDIIFSLRGRNKVEEEDQYVISVVNLFKDDYMEPKKYYNAYKKAIRSIAEHLQKQGSTVIFLSFCNTEGDNKVIDEVISEITDKKNILVKSYEQMGMEETIKCIESSKGIVATRFHAMILGFLFGKKVFPIVYNEKMKNILDDIKYQGSFLQMKDLQDYRVGNIEDYFFEISEDEKQKLRKQAEKHFEMLDKILS